MTTTDFEIHSLVLKISRHLNTQDPLNDFHVLLLEDGSVALILRDTTNLGPLFSLHGIMHALSDHPGFPKVNPDFLFNPSGTPIGFMREHLPHAEFDWTRLPDFAAGVTLEAWLRHGIHLALALHAMHLLGWSHRDLKPENIGFRQTPRGLRPVLFDLDTVKPLNTPAMNEQRQVQGSPPYMAPEQTRGQLFTTQSDLFSLAVTLLSILLRTHGFYWRDVERNTPQAELEVIRHIARNSYPHWCDVDRLLPQDLASVFSRAMQLKPEDRQTSCLMFAQQLMHTLLRLPQTERERIVIEPKRTEGSQRIVLTPQTGAESDPTTTTVSSDEVLFI